jgi:hypothetical protein
LWELLGGGVPPSAGMYACPVWLRGIGLLRDERGSYQLVVMVMPIDPVVDLAIPRELEGIPVTVEAMV